LIRIEDIDPPRERPGAAASQIATLAALGLVADEPVRYQSARSPAYAAALERLRDQGRIFHCDCSRATLAGRTPPGAEAAAAYPGTCRRRGLGPAHAARFLVDAGSVACHDRALGTYTQDVARSVGDFIVRRADGLWAYQLAVVVDDADQGITDVVRGADLLDNTPRQVLLQRALGLPTPRYLHVPLVLDDQGRKLSKQDGAQALEAGDPLRALERAWQHLGFERTGATDIGRFQQRATAAWARRWCASSSAAGATPAQGQTR
jgi:glutamyl-Q tRNA(Asp) synthetase